MFVGLDIHHAAIANGESYEYNEAIDSYFKDPTNLEDALAHEDSRYHDAAKIYQHNLGAAAYFSKDPLNFQRALGNVANEFHTDAVNMSLSDEGTFVQAFVSDKDPLHDAAVNLGIDRRAHV